MKNILGILVAFVILISCRNSEQAKIDNFELQEYHETKHERYELSKPRENIIAVLVLFGGFRENAGDIRKEFEILKNAMENKVAILYMNYNQKLWLSMNDKTLLVKHLESIFNDNKLPTDNIYIGGFSSGGNVTLLITNNLISTNSSIQPKGLFIVDSPLDLLELYRLSKKNIESNFSQGSIQEATWLINVFKSEFGVPENGIKEYESYSPYTSETNNIKNISNLNGLKIRFYSEPDTVWWRENRNNEPTDLNAFWIRKLVTQLKNELSNSSVEYIFTENKGYRANGERHPHSWSIVDKKDLLDWIIKKRLPTEL